jgi:ligand-binding sensor domain-containing protein/two-component sensor histidine kinase
LILAKHKYRGTLVLFSLLLFPSAIQAERLPIKTYTVADGLANNVVNKIVRDSRGFLWFCTNEGLSRYDGYRFTNYGTQQGLPHALVNNLLETREGEYWLASEGGLIRFDPRGTPSSQVIYANQATNSGTPMFTVVVPEDEDHRARAITVVYESRDGTIWCGTRKGLHRLDQSNGRLKLQPVDIGIPNEYPEQRFITDILEDSHGSFWIAAASGLYRRWPDGSAARYTKRDGLTNEYLQALFEDHEGRLWAGTRVGGFFRFVADVTHRPPVIAAHFSQEEGLPTSWIAQLFESSDRRFWLATARGLIEFIPDGNAAGGRFHVYTTRNGLSYHAITALNEDAAGNLWLGNNLGAMKLDRGGFVTYDAADGIVAMNAIFEDREHAMCFRGYILGDSHKSIFEGAKVDVISPDLGQFVLRLGRFDGHAFNWFLPDAWKEIDKGWVGEGITLQARNGEWWIGAGLGLYRFPAEARFDGIKAAHPIAVYTTKDGLPGLQVFRLFEDSRGDIWISTTSALANGLARWERASETIRDLANNPSVAPFKGELARSFCEDQSGEVWIGSNTGLARFHHDKFTFFGANDGLPPGAIQYIYQDHAGRLWLASSRSGLIRVDRPTADKPMFVSYSTTQGLSSDNAEVITEDLLGHLYVGTGRGLDRFDAATGGIEHFTTADGLAAGGFLSAFRDHDGALWFGTEKGMSRFVPGLDRAAAPPPILIAGLQIAGVPQPVSALGEKAIALPNLAANQNQLQIDFLALDFTPGDVLRYQYKLEGADRDWSAPSEQRGVNYARLAPGRYQFFVRAVNSHGLMSSSPAVVTFTILHPIWQRWWFVLLAVLTIALMVYAFFRYRVSRILEVANIRAGIAADLHDDIGSNLTRIAILSEVAHSRLQGANAAVDSPLKSIAEISRESVASMGDIVWAINPRRDTLLDLVQRMRRLATEVFSARGIVFEFRAPGSHDDSKLGANVRRDLFLIFKEAVNNIARHSGAKHVEIDLQVERTSIALTVRDDGGGFDPEKINEGQGLASMKRRAQNLGGDLTIASQGGTGTELALRFRRRSR